MFLKLFGRKKCGVDGVEINRELKSLSFIYQIHLKDSKINYKIKLFVYKWYLIICVFASTLILSFFVDQMRELSNLLRYNSLR